ncbi:DUF4190 domain-containing protein [Nonomuraea longicatena]|uniref:DUF4190 domain-containing protein n=1 Tax=Nonomuraea longicatena TaxID=83682 RepID=A0ABN1QLW3_9ACTN
MSYPPPYGPYGLYGPPLTHPQGTAVLVLGILGLVACLPVAPFAWRMGTTALREIDGSGYVYENRGLVNAGRVCGIVGTCLLAAIVIIYGGFLMLALVAAGLSS